MDLQLYKAEVIDVDDTDKEGKIKIKVCPELEKVDDDLLPWAVPFTMSVSDSTLSNDLPKKGSTVRVLIDSTWKRFYYIGNAYFYGLFTFDDVTSKLSNIDGIDTEYKNLKFRMFEDGGIEFHNNKDGSHGYISPLGTYSVIDGEGNVVVKVDPSKKVTIGNGTYNLGAILKELIDDLSQLKTVGSPSTHTSPTLTSQMNQLLPKVQALFTTD